MSPKLVALFLALAVMPFMGACTPTATEGDSTSTEPVEEPDQAGIITEPEEPIGGAELAEPEAPAASSDEFSGSESPEVPATGELPESPESLTDPNLSESPAPAFPDGNAAEEPPAE